MADHDQVKQYLNKKLGAPVKKPKMSDWLRLEDSPEEAKPEPQIEFEHSIIVDSEHPDAGYAVVGEDGKVTVHLHDDWSIRQWRGSALKHYLDAGEKRISVPQIAILNYDPVNQRTCVWFSPGRDFIESFAAEFSDHYDFDKPHELHQCGHAAIIKQAGVPTPSCISDQSMAQCSFYEPESWRNVKEIKAELGPEDTVRIVLQYTRKGSGFPTYRILRYNNETEIPVQLDTLAGIEHKANIHDVAKQFFDGRVQELNSENVVEVEIPATEVAPTVRYFDYVLA